MPIGIQDFEKQRTFSGLYADKAEYVWRLVNEPAPYFLSRPRRFGKSLFLTTLKVCFQGKKELFDRLAIAGRKTAWQEYPVPHLDFNLPGYGSAAALDNFIGGCFGRIEKEQGLGRTRFELLPFRGGIEIPEAAVNGCQPGDITPVPLLHQSGRFTIRGYDRDLRPKPQRRQANRRDFRANA